MAKLFAGTSGFAYPSWKPSFYPKDVPAKKFLDHYSRRLNAVEINYTFRRLPAASTLKNWIEATPEGFVFALKAHQRITHFQRLKNSEEFTAAFFHSVEPLLEAGKLGPVLFQLPPQLHCDVTLLADYLAIVPRAVHVAFEFRHTSWLTDEVYGLLLERNASLCLAESETLTIPHVLTADFVYFRLRKPDYAPQDRREIGAGVSKILEQGKDVYVFFKHEDTPEGAFHAEELLRGISS
jgi:uncharacterized protein YecE (DUF72 family)